jgi:hydroxymethylpyrimidine pyrophosphatase-like HAD family hydrolase
VSRVEDGSGTGMGPRWFPRALFLDLDGTLLAPGSVLTQRTTDAVRRAAERGTAIVLATGGFSQRARELVRVLDRGVPARTWVVTHNGGAIWSPDGMLVRQQASPPEAMQTVIEYAGPRVWLAFEAVDGDGRTSMYYAGRQRPEMHEFVWGPLEEAIGGDASREWRPARGQRARSGEDILSCWCVGQPEALRPLDEMAVDGALMGARYAAWSSRLAQILGRPRMRAEGRDIGHLDATKGEAMKWICRQLDIPVRETAAFGDANNDLEMLALAGTAVAMPHASPEVLACADMVAPPNGEDGVARVLEGWLHLRDY